MQGQVFLIKNFTADIPIDVSDAIAVVFISTTGNRVEVDLRSDGRVVVEADEMVLHPHASNMVCVESRKVSVKQSHYPLKDTHGKEVNICYCGKAWPHDAA